jgi:triosephosphate isomerase
VPSVTQTPGRLNLIDVGNFTVLIDFAHNPAGMEALSKFVEKLPNKVKTGVIGGTGDRRDEDIRNLGKSAAKMLTSIDMEYVLVGHSERREYFNESDTILLEKLNQSFENGLKPIFCCGEPLGERSSGNHVQYVGDQIRNVLFLLTPQQLNSTIIAYEPIWAIGTGQTASPEQAQEMHLLIRDVLKEKFEPEMVESISILYGGSVNAGNALSIFGQKDVDGGLVGGASLKVNDFLDIIKAMESIG